MCEALPRNLACNARGDPGNHVRASGARHVAMQGSSVWDDPVVLLLCLDRCPARSALRRRLSCHEKRSHQRARLPSGLQLCPCRQECRQWHSHYVGAVAAHSRTVGSPCRPRFDGTHYHRRNSSITGESRPACPKALPLHARTAWPPCPGVPLHRLLSRGVRHPSVLRFVARPDSRLRGNIRTYRCERDPLA